MSFLFCVSVCVCRVLTHSPWTPLLKRALLGCGGQRGGTWRGEENIFSVINVGGVLQLR